MKFNPDPFKQAQDVLFSRKIKSQNHPCLHFHNNPVNQKPLQKHRGTYLDPKLDFLEHLKNIQAKVNKPIALLLDPTLIMVTPYMTKLTMILFIKKLESIQYDAALAITGAIRGTSSEKLYQGLGLKSLQQRRWYLKLCTFLITVK